MHIMEGFLPLPYAAAWTAVSAPFIGYGIWRLTKELRNNPQARLLLGAAGGFAFILSALKIPSVTGSCSHPTGVGLGTVLFGPGIMSVLGSIVLLFQALLLAHGGLTTLGANIFSMAVVGCYVAWGVFRVGRGLGLPLSVSVFLAAALSNVCTYLTTSAQLAMAFPDPVSGFAGSFAKFAGIFALTQLPLAVSEGLLSVLVMNLLVRHGQPELRTLPHLKEAIA